MSNILILHSAPMLSAPLGAAYVSVPFPFPFLLHCFISVTKCLEMGLVDEEGAPVNSTRGFLVSFLVVHCMVHAAVWCQLKTLGY